MTIYNIDNTNIYHIHNGLDELGRILNLSRLPGESNGSYRDRLARVYAQPGNARYDGLVYAINRALGYDVQEAITITAVAGPMTNSTRMQIKAQTLTLWVDEEVEASFYLRDTSVQTLTLLVDAINSTSYFSAALVNAGDADAFSFGLVDADSWLWELSEVIPASHIFALKNTFIVKDTVVFDEDEVFYTFIDNPTQAGDFYLNVETGQVKVITQPSGFGKVAYQYYSNTLTLSLAPVVIGDFNETAMRHWMFHEIEKNVWATPAEKYSLGQPYELAETIIDELKEKCPNFWDGWKWDEGRWMPEIGK